MELDRTVMKRAALTRPDIELRLDPQGIIESVLLTPGLPAEALEGWVGRAWAETVSDAAAEQLRRLLAQVRQDGVSAFLSLTQRFPRGEEVPVEYAAFRLDEAGRVVAVGRTLQVVADLQARLIAAQQAREQDYWKLREAEARARLLFDTGEQAMLLLSAATLRVEEANPVAIRVLGVAPGWDFLQELAPPDRAVFRDLVGRAREPGRVPPVRVQIGHDHAAWLVRVTLVPRDSDPLLLVHLAPADAGGVRMPVPTGLRAEALLDQMPDGFVALDQDGIIQRANRAFLDLAQAGSEASVLGERLDRWIGQPGMDMQVMLASIAQHGVLRLFPARFVGTLGSEAEVEISGTLHTETGVPVIGLLIRDIGRRVLPATEAAALHEALESLANEVGRLPLPTIVRNTSALVERACIEEALRQSGGNRTAAADALGLSRQSLYAKLDRYRLEDRSASSAK
jgi:transcriptional regulator PpsR